MALKQLIIILAFFLSQTILCAQTGHALFVAVDKYPEGSGWAEIHATNDLALVRAMLEGRTFPKKNISALLNEEATKAAVTGALERLASKVRPGDCVYIHFSCHGQQMADNDGDEPDGLDEALIPYDARRRFTPGIYEGNNHLRDDELGALLDRIRRKAGPKGEMILVLDACHSGTGDRDNDEETYVRGTAYIFAPPGFVPVIGRGKDSCVRSAPDIAPMLVVAACMPDQLNYEYRSPDDRRYYGSLTYALCGILARRQPVARGGLSEELAVRIARQNAGSRRNRVQTPLVETSDETKAFRIGIREGR